MNEKYDLSLLGFVSPQDGSPIVTFEFASFVGLEYGTPAAAAAHDELRARGVNLNAFLKALAPSNKGYWYGQIMDFDKYLPPPAK